MEPISGKLEKKSVFLPYCGDKADTCHDRAKIFRSGHLELYEIKTASFIMVEPLGKAVL